MAQLRLFVRVPGGERVHDFDKDEVVVGRDDAADVRLDDRRSSRRHCRLYRAADGWHVADLASRNGTTLNGAPVLDARLTEGDHVEVGHATLAISFPGTRDDDAYDTARGPIALERAAEPTGPGLAPVAVPSPAREVRALEHLIELNRRIAQADDEDSLLDAVLDAAIELLGAGRGLLLLSAGDHVVVRRARKPGGVDLEDPAA